MNEETRDQATYRYMQEARQHLIRLLERYREDNMPVFIIAKIERAIRQVDDCDEIYWHRANPS